MVIYRELYIYLYMYRYLPAPQVREHNAPNKYNDLLIDYYRTNNRKETNTSG